MTYFQNTFETRKRSFISAFTICTTVPLSIFRRLGPFSQVFARVKEWNILKQFEIIRVSHLVACPMFFNLLCHLTRQTRACSNLRKKVNFKYFQTFGSFSQSFWAGKGVAYYGTAKDHKIVPCNGVPNCFSFRRSVQSNENDHFLVFLTVWVLFLKFLGR